MIKSQNQLMSMRTRLIDKHTQDLFRIHEVVVRKQGGAINVIDMPANAFTRMRNVRPDLVKVIDEYVARNGATVKVVKDFCTSTFVLKVEDKKRLRTILESVVYARFAGADTCFWCKSADLGINLFNPKETVDINVLESSAGIMKFIAGKCSPSQIRRGILAFEDVTDGVDCAEELTDLLTAGAYAELVNKVFSLGTGNKSYSRTTLGMAPSALWGLLGTIGIVTGKFGGSDAWDGLGIYRNKFLADCLTAKLGVQVTEAAVNGLAMQTRSMGYMAKVFGRGHNDQFMATVMQQYEVVHMDRSQQSNELLWNKDERVMGKMVILGESLIPDLIVDLNGLKAMVDFTKDLDFGVLDIAIGSGANTSTQLLYKVAGLGEDFTTFMGNTFRAHWDKSMGYLMEDKPTVPSLVDLEKGADYMSETIAHISPLYARNDAKLWHDILDNKIQGIMRDVNRLHMPVDGAFLRLMSDIAPLFGAPRVLKYGEVFAPHASKHFSKSDAEPVVTLIKYPSIGLGEFYQAKVVTMDEVIKRVGAMDIAREIKVVIIEWYQSTHNGVLIVPTVELLKKQLAGMDFDYDGVTAVYDAEFNALVKRVQSMIVDIVAPKAEPKDLSPFGMEMFPEILSSQFSSDGMSIGGITVSSEVFIAISSYELPEASELIKLIFGENNPIKEYQSPLVYDTVEIDGIVVPHVVVSVDHIKQVVDQIKTMIFTDESMGCLLKDLNVVFRLLQETKIDAPKTGVDPSGDFPVKPNSICKPGERYHKVHQFDWTKKTFDINPMF